MAMSEKVGMSRPGALRSFRVMLYVRFPLSLHNVEDLQQERGIDVSHETNPFWWNRFGPMCASEIRQRRVQQLRAFSRWQCHVDEVFLKTNRERHYLWRAVDHGGEVLESVVTSRRNKLAAVKMLRKLMRKYGQPEVLVPDRFPSCKAALRDLGCDRLQSCGRWLNNRVENSHLRFRRQERAMQRFRRMRSLQNVAVHSPVFNHFNQDRSVSARDHFKENRNVTLAELRGLRSA